MFPGSLWKEAIFPGGTCTPPFTDMDQWWVTGPFISQSLLGGGTSRFLSNWCFHEEEGMLWLPTWRLLQRYNKGMWLHYVHPLRPSTTRAGVHDCGSRTRIQGYMEDGVIQKIPQLLREYPLQILFSILKILVLSFFTIFSFNWYHQRW